MSAAALRLCLAAILALTPAQGMAQAPPALSDTEVAQGIKLVDEGEYDAAILLLDGAARRLAQRPDQQQALSEAYLYLGVAYLGKGHETSAKARFRDALAQMKTLDVTPDRFAPRVVELFEKAREEMSAASPAPAGPAASATPAPATTGTVPKKGGGSKALLVVGGLAVVGGGVALAAGSGGGDGGTANGPGSNGPDRRTSFPNEGMRVGAGKDFFVTVTGRGTLTARLDWQPDGVLLDMYIVAAGNLPQVLATGTRTGTSEMTLVLPVTAQNYRLSVTHSSGQGRQVDATFNLNVTHP
jgi:hypothetical protein